MEDTKIIYTTAILANSKGFPGLKSFPETKTHWEFSGLNYAQSILQKWLRDKHNIHIMIKPWEGKNFQVFVLHEIPGHENEDYCEEYNPRKCHPTYEMALEAGMVEALNLL